MDRDLADGGVGARFVVGWLHEGDRTLLVRRSPRRTWFPGLWDLPGGRVEGAEHDLDALRRELVEELGIHVGSTVPIGRIREQDPPAGDLPAELRVIEVTTWEGEPYNRQPHEHVEIAWTRLSDLSDEALAHPEYRQFLASEAT